MHWFYIIFERAILSVASMSGGFALVAQSILGSTMLGKLKYRWNKETNYEMKGLDYFHLFILGPICIFAGLCYMFQFNLSIFFISLPGLYLIYNGLFCAIAQEWSNKNYDHINANSHEYWWIYYIEIISGLITLIGSISLFPVNSNIVLSTNWLRYFLVILIFCINFFSIFGFISEIREIIKGPYQNEKMNDIFMSSKTVFWAQKFFDLSISFPIGILAGYLLLTRVNTSLGLLFNLNGFSIILYIDCIIVFIMHKKMKHPDFHPFVFVMFPAFLAVYLCSYCLLVSYYFLFFTENK